MVQMYILGQKCFTMVTLVISKYFNILKNIQTHMENEKISLDLIEPYYSKAFRFSAIIITLFMINAFQYISNSIIKDSLKGFMNKEGTEMELSLPLGKMYFYDMPSVPTLFFLFYYVHWICCFVNCTIMAFFDAFIVTFLLLITGQIEILHYQIKQINFEELDCFKKFAVCVQHHQNIIRLFKDFNELTDLVLFFASSRAVCTICTFSFQATCIEKSDPQLLSIILTIILLSFEFFLYALYAERLSQKAEEAMDLLYFLNWVDSNNYRKVRMLSLMLQRTQQRLVLKGPFYQFTIQAFIQMYQFSFSVYTLFDQLKSEK